MLLPTRQQDTAPTQGNQRLLGKGGRKQGEMVSAALKKLCNREGAQESECGELHLLSLISSPGPSLEEAAQISTAPIPTPVLPTPPSLSPTHTLNRHIGHIKLLL